MADTIPRKLPQTPAFVPAPAFPEILHSRFHELWSLRLCTVAREGQLPALHAEHDLRDVPVPGWVDARSSWRQRTAGTYLPTRIPEASKEHNIVIGLQALNFSHGKV